MEWIMCLLIYELIFSGWLPIVESFGLASYGYPIENQIVETIPKYFFNITVLKTLSKKRKNKKVFKKYKIHAILIILNVKYWNISLKKIFVWIPLTSYLYFSCIILNLNEDSLFKNAKLLSIIFVIIYCWGIN